MTRKTDKALADMIDRIFDNAERDLYGPPASEDPTDPTLPRCEAIEQIGFRSTQVITSCDRPGTEVIDGRRACPGHAHQLRRQREIDATMPIGWTTQGRVYRS